MGGRLTPAVKYTILFSAGICLQSIFNIPLIFAATGLAICIIAVFIFREKSGFLIVCILFSGLCRMAISDTFFHENENYVFTSDTLTAEVLSRKAGPFFIKSYVLNLSDSIHSVKAVCYSKVNLPELLPGRYYSIVNYRLEKIVSPVNPYGFNYHAYCKRKGISHRLLFGSRTIV